MLYDKRWDRTEKPALFSIANFAAWLEKQNPKDRYVYMSCNCAIGQYLEANGTTYSAKCDTNLEDLCRWNADITQPRPHTFGAALARARTALTEGHRTESESRP